MIPKASADRSPSNLVLAFHVEDAIAGRSHVKPAVAQCVKIPIPTRVVIGHPLRDAVNDRFQLQREMHAEQFLRDGQPLILGDEFRVTVVCVVMVILLMLKKYPSITPSKARTAFRRTNDVLRKNPDEQ